MRGRALRAQKAARQAKASCGKQTVTRILEMRRLVKHRHCKRLTHHCGIALLLHHEGNVFPVPAADVVGLIELAVQQHLHQT